MAAKKGSSPPRDVTKESGGEIASHVDASPTRGDRSVPHVYTRRTIYAQPISGKIWTPVILSGGGARDAKDLGVRYTNGVSLVWVTKNPSVGEYTFCRGVYSFNQYDTDNKILLFAHWRIS